MRLRAGCLLLLCAAICLPAGAQLVYECRSSDGAHFFSESTCKSQGVRSAGKRGYSSPMPSRAEIRQRWGITEAVLAAVERKCGDLDNESCAKLAIYRTRTMAQAARELTDEAQAACKTGHQASCDVLAANKRDIRKSMDECSAGLKAKCEMLSRMAQ